MNFLTQLSTLFITALISLPLTANIDSPERTVEKWEQAIKGGNTEALSQAYTSDAVIIPPSLEILADQQDINKFWLNQLNQGAGNFQLDTIYLKVEGDTAYQTAIWSTTLTNSKGDSIDISSNMTNVLTRQQDGSWKIRLQSWN